MTLPAPGRPAGQVKVEGHFAMPRPSLGGNMLSIHTVPKDGVVVEVSASDTAGPIAVTVFDRSVGVPWGRRLPTPYVRDLTKLRTSKTGRNDREQSGVLVTLRLWRVRLLEPA